MTTTEAQPTPQPTPREPVCICPYCEHPIMPRERLSYPMTCLGRYYAVYRCARCHRHIGEPIVNVAVVETASATPS